MTTKPYRRGKQRACLLCTLPKDLQEEIMLMAKKRTFQEIVEWLKDRDIIATWNQVRYYLVKSGAKSRRTAIEPRHTYPDKVNAYIDALLESNAKTFTIYTICLHGATWSPVTKRLDSDGLIERYPVEGTCLERRDQRVEEP